jgi:hypothetical protein
MDLRNKTELAIIKHVLDMQTWKGGNNSMGRSLERILKRGMSELIQLKIPLALRK